MAGTVLFSVVHLAFTILFGRRLNQWNHSIPGLCYNTNGLATPDALHPNLDNAYLIVTCLYMYWLLFNAWVTLYCNIEFRGLRVQPKSEWMWAAILQMPLHLYFIIRLRLSNGVSLGGDSKENAWEFGQIFALVMSTSLLIECCKGIFGSF